MLKKVASEATKEDLIFSTEVDTTVMNFSRKNDSQTRLKASEAPIDEDAKGESTMMSEYAGNYSAPLDYAD